MFTSRRRGLARFVTFAWLLATVVSAQGGTDPVRLYNEAQSRETTLRVELASATAEPRLSLATRRRLRTLVGAYRDLARLFPTSGIADKALWQAAMLAGDTYTTWGDPTDRSAALRAFETLTGSYPNSSLARQVTAQTRRLWDARVRAVEPAAAPAATASASAAVPAVIPIAAPTPPLSPATPSVPAAVLAGARDVATPAVAGTTPAALREAGPAVTRPTLRPPASAPATAKTAPAPATPVAATAAATNLTASVSTPATPAAVTPAVATAPAAPPVAETPSIASLVAITHERVPGAVRVTLEVDRETAFQSDSLSSPARVFVDLKNTKSLERLRDAVIPVTDPVVQRIRVGRQPGNLTRVVLDLAQGRRYSAYTLYDPYRVVVDLEAPEAKASTATEVLTPTEKPATTARNTSPAAPVVLTAVATTTSVPAAVTAVAAAPAVVAAPVAATARTEPASPQILLSRQPTVAWKRQQEAAMPHSLQASDTTAAVNALAATRAGAEATAPAASSGASAITADISTAPRSTPLAADVPAAGNGPVAAAPGTASKTARGDYSLSRQLGLGVARVVIDAGHGGHDPGAKVKGLTEASLVLDIAQRLEQLLRKQPGVDVMMTRRTDVYVPLEERTEIANRAGADLFVSIHANASANPRARGVETYVLNFATSSEAEIIAARENAGSARTMRNLPDIVKTIATNNKVDESRELARMVQTSLHTQLKKGDAAMRNLGVKQAPFMVLIGATMPAILTEVAFVTNEDDAAHMKNDKYRQDVAEALLGGITRYQQSLKRTGPAVASQ